MKQINKIVIFIGSPSDTESERNSILEIVDELNQTLGAIKGVQIETKMWEHDVVPTIGTDGQDVINKQVSEYDIFVCLMWKKFGTPTARANSATEEEYLNALKSYHDNGHCKDIIVLFNNSNVPIDSDLDQLRLVTNFRKRVADDGVFYKTYNGLQDFCKVLRVALYHRIEALLNSSHDTYPLSASTKKVHVAPQVESIDENTKLLFDTLAHSPAINDVKSRFIESYILLFLYDNDYATSSEIRTYLANTLGDGNTNIYNTVLGRLNNTDLLISDDSHPKRFSISERKRKEIGQIKENVMTSSSKLKKKCEDICLKYDIKADPITLNTYISKLFEDGFSSEIGEWTRTALKRDLKLQNTYDDLVTYLQTTSGLPSEYVKPIANELIEIFSKDPIIYKSNTSRMFFSLFNNNKLEEYLSTNCRELFLDTQVLLQLCCVTFDYSEPMGADVLYKIGRRFWQKVRNNHNVKLYTTSEYVEEVAGHLYNAYRLSKFLELEYIQDLGPSKNVFFNHYLMIKDEAGLFSFDEYISMFLDEDDYWESRLDVPQIVKHLHNVFTDLSINVLSIPEVKEYPKYKKEYETSLAFMGFDSRSYTARRNDIYATLWCGNVFKTFENTPYLITTDTSFVGIRSRMVNKFDEISYWYVYSPQKISETLSLIDFKVDPSMIDDNIISLTESSFNTSNDTISFIDLLNTFVDDKKLSDWKLASKLSKMRKLRTCSVSENMFYNTNQPIDEFLLLLTEHYNARSEGYRFSDLKELFWNNDSADKVAEYIEAQLESFRIGTSKLSEDVYNYFDELISKLKA